MCIYIYIWNHRTAWLFPCPFDLSKQETNMPIHLPLTQLGLSWCDPAVAREVLSFPVMPGDTSYIIWRIFHADRIHRTGNFTNIYHYCTFKRNVGEYIIHGSYGMFTMASKKNAIIHSVPSGSSDPVGGAQAIPSCDHMCYPSCWNCW